MFLIDENLSPKFATVMSAIYKGSIHVDECKLSNSSDSSLWEYAKANDLVILTKDSDFHHMSNTFGCPPKVVRLTCGNKTTKAIIAIFQTQKTIIDTFITSDNICYLEITSNLSYGE